MSESDFKNGIFRCNGCTKTFKSVPEGREVFVLWQGKWVAYADMTEKPSEEVEEILEKVEENHLRACETCGEEFEPKRSDAIYCSDKCKKKAYRKKK
jgi:ribosomal protein L37AE/L43A